MTYREPFTPDPRFYDFLNRGQPSPYRAFIVPQENTETITQFPAPLPTALG